jgi:hypothetical protein
MLSAMGTTGDVCSSLFLLNSPAATMAEDSTPNGRSASALVAGAVMNFNPQLGMWAATGTAIAYAPTLNELREPLAGGENIEFNDHGHRARIVATDETGALALSATITKTPTVVNREDTADVSPPALLSTIERRPTLYELTRADEKHN